MESTETLNEKQDAVLMLNYQIKVTVLIPCSTIQMHELIIEIEYFWKVSLSIFYKKVQKCCFVLSVLCIAQLKPKIKLTERYIM